MWAPTLKPENDDEIIPSGSDQQQQEASSTTNPLFIEGDQKRELQVTPPVAASITPPPASATPNGRPASSAPQAAITPNGDDNNNDDDDDDDNDQQGEDFKTPDNQNRIQAASHSGGLMMNPNDGEEDDDLSDTSDDEEGATAQSQSSPPNNNNNKRNFALTELTLGAHNNNALGESPQQAVSPVVAHNRRNNTSRSPSPANSVHSASSSQRRMRAAMAKVQRPATPASSMRSSPSANEMAQENDNDDDDDNNNNNSQPRSTSRNSSLRSVNMKPHAVGTPVHMKSLPTNDEENGDSGNNNVVNGVEANKISKENSGVVNNNTNTEEEQPRAHDDEEEMVNDEPRQEENDNNNTDNNDNDDVQELDTPPNEQQRIQQDDEDVDELDTPNPEDNNNYNEPTNQPEQQEQKQVAPPPPPPRRPQSYPITNSNQIQSLFQFDNNKNNSNNDNHQSSHSDEQAGEEQEELFVKLLHELLVKSALNGDYKSMKTILNFLDGKEEEANTDDKNDEDDQQKQDHASGMDRIDGKQMFRSLASKTSGNIFRDTFQASLSHLERHQPETESATPQRFDCIALLLEFIAENKNRDQTVSLASQSFLLSFAGEIFADPGITTNHFAILQLGNIVTNATITSNSPADENTTNLLDRLLPPLLLCLERLGNAGCNRSQIYADQHEDVAPAQAALDAVTSVVDSILHVCAINNNNNKTTSSIKKEPCFAALPDSALISIASLYSSAFLKLIPGIASFVEYGRLVSLLGHGLALPEIYQETNVALSEEIRDRSTVECENFQGTRLHSLCTTLAILAWRVHSSSSSSSSASLSMMTIQDNILVTIQNLIHSKTESEESLYSQEVLTSVILKSLRESMEKKKDGGTANNNQDDDDDIEYEVRTRNFVKLVEGFSMSLEESGKMTRKIDQRQQQVDDDNDDSFPRDPREVRRVEKLKKKHKQELTTALSNQEKELNEKFAKTLEEKLTTARVETDQSNQKVSDLSAELDQIKQEAEDLKRQLAESEELRQNAERQTDSARELSNQAHASFFYKLEQIEESTRLLVESSLFDQLQHLTETIFEETKPKFIKNPDFEDYQRRLVIDFEDLLRFQLTAREEETLLESKKIDKLGRNLIEEKEFSADATKCANQDLLARCNVLEEERRQLAYAKKELDRVKAMRKEEIAQETSPLRTQIVLLEEKLKDTNARLDRERKAHQKDAAASNKSLSSTKKDLEASQMALRDLRNSQSKFTSEKTQLTKKIDELERQNEALRHDLEDTATSSSLKQWCHDATSEMLSQTKRATVAEENLQQAHLHSREMLTEFNQLCEIINRLEKQVVYILEAQKIVSIGHLNTTELQPMVNEVKRRLGMNNNSSSSRRHDEQLAEGRSPRPPSSTPVSAGTNHRRHLNFQTPTHHQHYQAVAAADEKVRRSKEGNDDDDYNNADLDHHHRDHDQQHDDNTSNGGTTPRAKTSTMSMKPTTSKPIDDSVIQRIARVSAARQQPNYISGKPSRTLPSLSVANPRLAGFKNYNELLDSAGMSSSTPMKSSSSAARSKSPFHVSRITKNAKPIPVIGPFGVKTPSPKREY